MPGRKKVTAHRVAYECEHGPLPVGMCVLHKCDTPACINPQHLVAGTQSENMLDRSAKGRVGRSGGGHPRLANRVADIVRWRSQGLSVRAIARRLDANTCSIRYRLRKAGFQ
ncbi:HNH endonuclease signature motif containing protein [Brevundimonas sp. LjRoot202]|uniref:HNH endonuclease signature motif containing protein n=1 Tax=Brevundimonas sp. LjRoot202 TaxID=3342281 RepID=UPI003F4FD5BE